MDQWYSTRVRVIPTQAQRASELLQAMQGGIHQGFKPSFAFNGKLAVAYGNRKGDRDHERAERCGYHTTVPRAVEGEQEAKEVLNLLVELGTLARQINWMEGPRRSRQIESVWS